MKKAKYKKQKILLKSIKKELKLKERIIEAKDETIRAKEQELVNIKEIYNNLLHLYNESKVLSSKQNELQVENKSQKDGYMTISGAEFAKKMQNMGYALDEIKQILVANILENKMDLVDGFLVVRDNFFEITEV